MKNPNPNLLAQPAVALKAALLLTLPSIRAESLARATVTIQ
jgi:hypothetical protein